MMTEFYSKARILKCLFSKLPLFYILLKYSVVPVIFTGYVWRHWRTSTNIFTISCLSIEPPSPGKFSSTAVLQSLAKSLLHYSYYSSPIRGLFVLFVDYSYYSSTIRGLFVLFVDYSHYSLHYSSFINCRKRRVKNCKFQFDSSDS
jgi:hypothetical protein